jgi:hypothetical protein
MYADCFCAGSFALLSVFLPLALLISSGLFFLSGLHVFWKLNLLFGLHSIGCISAMPVTYHLSYQE